MSKQSDLVSVSQGSGGDPLYIDTTNDRVGVGTTSPTRQLEVSKAGTSYIRAADTTNSVNVDLLAASSGGWVGTQSNHPFLLQTNNTERMRIDNAGRVTKPYQPSFRAYKASSSTSAGIVSWSGTFHNIGNHFNQSTGVFTAPVSGVYLASVHYLTENESNQVSAYIRLNGVPNNGVRMRSASSAGHQTTSGTHAIYMNANDTLDVYKESSGTFYGDSSWVWSSFSAQLLS